MKIYTPGQGSRIVRPEGPEDADIMIVGEAPGAQEERLGRPFVGDSGRLLDDLLARSMILRSMCYITNVVKERPPENDISHFIRFGRNGVSVTQAYEEYIKLLKEEIKKVNPNVIVATGAVPLYALTGLQGITKWRGSILESALVSGKKVIPVFHPAAALRQYLWRHFISFDLRKVKRECTHPNLPVDNRVYYLSPTFDLTMEYLHHCEKQSLTAFDIEVGRGTVSCISFAASKNDVISIPFMAGGQHYFILPQEVEIWKLIASILESDRIDKIAQNGVFDTTFLHREYGIRSRRVQDTMIAQAILYPDFPKGLDFITSVYTDIPYYKDEGKSVIKDQLRGISGNLSQEKRFWLYNAKDSIVLMEAFPRQVEELVRTNNWSTYENQAKLLGPLLFINERGIKMDVEGMKKASEKAGDRLEELTAELQKLCGYSINPNSPKQLLDYFYDRLRIKPYLKDGKPTVDEKALKRLARKRKEASILLEIRKLAKARGTYFEMKLDEDNRLRSSINPVGTKTGRLSSSKTIYGTGANIQNQPPEMKRYMLTDEGYVGYNLDLSQAENRVVAYLGPDISMIEAFENGIDIHAKTASLIFRIPIDEIIDMDKNEVMSEIGGGVYTHRFWGKKANHGLNYGLGYKTFALYYEIDEKEAEFIVRSYHQAYPGVEKFHEQVKEQLKKDRTLTNLFGRRYRFADRWSETLWKEAYAFMPQSTVADNMNRNGLNKVYYDQTNFGPLEILNQIHDSIVVQIPLSVGWEEHARMLLQIKESLETPLQYGGRDFHLPVDMKMHPHNLLQGKEMKHSTFHPGLTIVDFAERLRSTYEELTKEDHAA